jgi:hypothetical protein
VYQGGRTGGLVVGSREVTGNSVAVLATAWTSTDKVCKGKLHNVCACMIPMKMPWYIVG